MSSNTLPRILSLLMLVLGFAAAPVAALQMLTEENPPYNYSQNKQLTGLSTEVLVEMGRRANVPMTFAVLPWPQAYEQAQRNQESCIFSTARVENRERVFKWIGPLATNSWGLFSLRGFKDPIKTLADARPYRIGGVADDAKIVWLRNNAVTNIVEVNEDKLIPPMLTLDRKKLNAVDLWITGIYAQKATAASANVKDIKLVLKVNDQSLWLACNPGVPGATIKVLSDALAGMKQDGAYKKIADAYEKRFAP